MAWLSEWLRQIIAIILLAGIIDLLLPSNAYQRYVRLVVGLLILLTLLSPILRLLQGDFKTKLADDWTGWPIVADTGKMQGLESIQERGRRLQEERMKKAAQLTERRLAGMLLEQLPKKTGYPLEAVDVRIERNERNGEQVVTMVNIVLQGNVKGDVQAIDQNKDKNVETVEPVAVEIAVPVLAQEGSAGSSSEDIRVGTVYPLSTSDTRYRSIASVLMNNWGIAPDIVRISAPAEEKRADEDREGHGGGWLAD